MLGKEQAGLEEETWLLVERAVQGDAETFGKLYDLYVDRVYRHVYYRVGNQSDAEDLTSQVFLNAWRAISRYRPMGRPFVVWLLSIAHNLIIDHYRARKEQVNLDDVVIPSGDHANPEVALEQLLTNQRLRGAIRKLKPDQQQVVVMRFIEGWEYQDIAATMRKSQGAVRVILHRALVALRGILQQQEGVR